MMDPSKIANERTILSRSLWAATARPGVRTVPLAGDAKAEIAVVGAGFTGLSAALHLAERGVRVVVLETESPGWGASGRNGGQVIPGLKEDPDDIERIFGREIGERLVRFAGQAPDIAFDLISRHGIDCDAVRTGWLQPAHDDRSLATLERRVEQWGRRGAPISLLDRAATARLIGSDAYGRAALDRRGGSLHPLNYVIGLAEAALRAGVTIHGNSRALELSRENGAFRLKTVHGSLRADQVLLCTNGYTDRLVDRLGRSVIPVCSVQVASRPLSPNVRATILPEGQVASDMRRLLLYYRLTKDGRLVMGGRGAYGERSIAGQMARLRRLAGALFPQLGEADWEHHWGGYVAMTADHFPHLHELQPGVTAALGYNGRGVAMASAMGRVLADKASGVPAQDLEYPTTPLRPISLHALRKPVVSILVAWNGWRDRLEAQGSSRRRE